MTKKKKQEKQEKISLAQAQRNFDADCEGEFDETDPVATAKIRTFLDEYKVLCKKHGCLIVAPGEDVDGQDVEVVPCKAWAEEDDPWEIEETTRKRGWKI